MQKVKRVTHGSDLTWDEAQKMAIAQWDASYYELAPSSTSLTSVSNSPVLLNKRNLLWAKRYELIWTLSAHRFKMDLPEGEINPWQYPTSRRVSRKLHEVCVAFFPVIFILPSILSLYSSKSIESIGVLSCTLRSRRCLTEQWPFFVPRLKVPGSQLPSWGPCVTLSTSSWS